MSRTHYLKRAGRRAPRRSDGRRTRIIVGIGAVVAVVAAAVTFGTARHTGKPTQNFHQSASQPHSFSVVTYGADPTGTTDSTVAIRAAITAAEATAGNTVVFPPGTFTLDRNDGAGVDLKIVGPNPIVVQGAGRDSTTIVEHIGKVTHPTLRRGKDVFQIVGAPNHGAGGGDGSTVTGLTVDSATYDAGTTYISFANNTTLSHAHMLGATSLPTYNVNVFTVRGLGGCNPTHLADHRSGVVFDDLLLAGRGTAGNVDLNLSCEWDAKVTNVVDDGDGIGLYLVKRVAVTGYRWTPGATPDRDPHSWYITGPSDHISLTNVTTSGDGGHIKNSPDRISDVSVTSETMTDPARSILVGDADRTTITGSTLGVLRLAPDFSLNGLTVTGSTTASVTCKTGATITGLVGTSCPLR